MTNDTRIQRLEEYLDYLVFTKQLSSEDMKHIMAEVRGIAKSK